MYQFNSINSLYLRNLYIFTPLDARNFNYLMIFFPFTM